MRYFLRKEGRPPSSGRYDLLKDTSAQQKEAFACSSIDCLIDLSLLKGSEGLKDVESRKVNVLLPDFSPTKWARKSTQQVIKYVRSSD